MRVPKIIYIHIYIFTHPVDPSVLILCINISLVNIASLCPSSTKTPFPSLHQFITSLSLSLSSKPSQHIHGGRRPGSLPRAPTEQKRQAPFHPPKPPTPTTVFSASLLRIPPLRRRLFPGRRTQKLGSSGPVHRLRFDTEAVQVSEACPAAPRGFLRVGSTRLGSSSAQLLELLRQRSPGRRSDEELSADHHAGGGVQEVQTILPTNGVGGGII